MACGCENTREIFPNCDMSRWEVQCSSYIEDADNYYTKPQIDEMLEEIESAITSGCCITPEEVDEKISAATSGLQTTLEAGEHIIINGDVISTSGLQETLVAGDNITISGNVISAVGGSGSTDLSNYYNKQEVDSLINSVSSEITQYITNIQQQINSLIETVSGCCGSTGETQYRWITMTGENEYWCDDTTKKSLEKQQSSTDGLTWVDTGNIRSGSTILEYDSVDCGYDINTGLKITLNDNTVITYDCEDLETITCSGQTKYKLTHAIVMSALTSPSDVKRIDIGTCVELIGADAFSGLTNLQKVVIPSTFENIRSHQCDGIDVNAFESTAIRTVGLQGSGADVEWNNNMDEMAFAMFKGCTSLTSVELHSGFETFDPYVFSGCTNLQSITLHSTALPVLNSYAQGGYQYDALDGIGNNTFVIYVPSDMVDTYKNSVDPTGLKNWSKYANHIQPIP